MPVILCWKFGMLQYRAQETISDSRQHVFIERHIETRMVRSSRSAPVVAPDRRLENRIFAAVEAAVAIVIAHRVGG